MEPLAEYVDGLPNLCGQESLISEAITAGRKYPVFPQDGAIERAASTFAVALHMHQPLIPVGGDLHSAPVISNLAWMMDHQDIGDNHNAPVFVWCYKRMGEFIGQLLGEGRQPRVMLDYSGTLLMGCGRWAWMTYSMRSGTSPVIPGPGRPWSGSAAPGATRWPPPRPRRTSGCTCAPGSTISLPSSALRRSGASGDSPPQRWRCPTTRMSLARSSVPWPTAAISGCWSRSTPWNSPTDAALSTRICRTGWCAQTRAATPPASSR